MAYNRIFAFHAHIAKITTASDRTPIQRRRCFLRWISRFRAEGWGAYKFTGEERRWRRTMSGIFSTASLMSAAICFENTGSSVLFFDFFEDDVLGIPCAGIILWRRQKFWFPLEEGLFSSG